MNKALRHKCIVPCLGIILMPLTALADISTPDQAINQFCAQYFTWGHRLLDAPATLDTCKAHFQANDSGKGWYEIQVRPEFQRHGGVIWSVDKKSGKVGTVAILE